MAEQRSMACQKYSLEFTHAQWVEIESLGLTGFRPQAGEALWRDQWVAIGHMLLGKATRLRDGAYGGGETWADELIVIADEIFNQFKPGDMRL